MQTTTHTPAGRIALPATLGTELDDLAWSHPAQGYATTAAARQRVRFVSLELTIADFCKRMNAREVSHG